MPQPCPAGLCRSQHPAGSVGHRDLPVPDTQRARGGAQGCGVLAWSSSSTRGLVRRAMVRETLAWTGSRGGIPTGTGQTDGHNLSTVLCPHHEPWHSASVTSREAPRSAAWSKRSHFWTSTPKLRTAVFTLVAERYQLPVAVKTAPFFFSPLFQQNVTQFWGFNSGCDKSRVLEGWGLPHSHRGSDGFLLKESISWCLLWVLEVVGSGKQPQLAVG